MVGKKNDSSANTEAEARKFQFIFMAIGIAIIVCGLWWLYWNNAPYHPDGTSAEAYRQSATDG